jgi:transaldolase
VAGIVYEAYVDLQSSLRCTRLAELGAHPQRLLWASTGTKDASTPATLYVQALAAPETVNTMPDKTLLAVAAGPAIEPTLVPDASEAKETLAEFKKLGIDVEALAGQLQKEGAGSFQKSWDEMLAGIAKKVSRQAGAASK